MVVGQHGSDVERVQISARSLQRSALDGRAAEEHRILQHLRDITGGLTNASMLLPAS
jgi:hypothetical protein